MVLRVGEVSQHGGLKLERGGSTRRTSSERRQPLGFGQMRGNLRVIAHTSARRLIRASLVCRTGVGRSGGVGRAPAAAHNFPSRDGLRPPSRRARSAREATRSRSRRAPPGRGFAVAMAERFGFQAGKLMMSQFRSRTRIGRKKRLLQEAEKILRSGAVEEPKWFTGLKTCVPAARDTRARAVLGRRATPRRRLFYPNPSAARHRIRPIRPPLARPSARPPD